MAKTSLRERLLVAPGAVDLAAIDTRGKPGGPKDKTAARAQRETLGDELADLQERLWAEADVDGSKRRVLLVLQGMDTSGKDGVVKRGLGGMNPKWLHAKGFEAPTEEELAHHFLWRIKQQLPEPGVVGVFDRSHYEDVVAVRARGLAGEEIWRPRMDEINRFEHQLSEDGVTIVKVFLHISRPYQLERQLRRLDRPDKRWKFDASDIDDRELWDEYMAAYAEVLEHCNTPWAPWYVVPADRKWYRMWAVGRLVLEALREVDPRFPERPDLDLDALRKRLHAS